MIYKIYNLDDEWKVYSGREHPKTFWVKDDIVFSNKSITECYYWIKARKEGLL